MSLPTTEAIGCRTKGTHVPSEDDSPLLFDRISERYDLLNHLLSFGMDIRWRRQVSRAIREVSHRHVLDLACGTCDLIISTLSRVRGVEWGIGVDMAGKMLAVGRRKVDRRGLGRKVGLVRGDGMWIPMAADTFDVAMVAFGIRNMIDPARALSEMYRVLKPGGRLTVLEFSMPQNRLFRAFYLPYFRHLLPRIGWIVSGDRHAYRYLNRTVESFYTQDEFLRIVEGVGFRNLRARPLTFGISTIYSGDKP